MEKDDDNKTEFVLVSFSFIAHRLYCDESFEGFAVH